MLCNLTHETSVRSDLLGLFHLFYHLCVIRNINTCTFGRRVLRFSQMPDFVYIFAKNFYNPTVQISQTTCSFITPFSRQQKCIFVLSAGYEAQNHPQPGNSSGGDGTSSLDCLSLIVESISPGTAAVAGLLQGQARPAVRLHGASKHEEIREHVTHTVPIVKVSQQ
jgi:hypothetical protein